VCGRFNIISDPLNRLILEITGQGFEVETQYNIAPTEDVPVLLLAEDGWSLRPMRWWLVPWWSDAPSTKYTMFNAKSETLTRSRAFREPFERRRCIVPASGYYEWQKDGKLRVPSYIMPEGQDGFAFAGLWDRWRSNERVVESCTIITTAALGEMQEIHSRVPVHLTSEEARRWVNGATEKAELESMLVPGMRFPLSITPVSTYVNNARNKEARCIEPLGDIRIIE
jgi:putative SOS response-associated peptidase YedK